MTSLLTNASAMTALQTLANTSKQMATTQSRIATGLRVAEASDNAAYWSIATGMRAQNSALSAAKDSMGFGSAVVDTAYTALNEAISKTEEVFAKYVSREQGGVDQDALDAEIDQLKAQVIAIAKNADFEGQNLLKTGGGDLTIVTGYIKNSGAAGTPTATPTITPDNSGATGDLGDTLTTAVGGDLNTATLAANESFTFSVGSKSYSVNAGSAGMNNASLIGSIQQQLTDDGYAVTWDGTDLDISVLASQNNQNISWGGGQITATSGGVQTLDVEAFDLEASLTSVNSSATAEEALTTMRAAAAKMGAAQMRISSQLDFTSKLMDAVDRGVGVLVDADMEAESARLSALQVQQQLGVQALSIANSNSQSILSLFR